MNYKHAAIELVEYLIKNEQEGRIIQKKLTEISKGEIAVLIFLLKEKNGVNAYEISSRFDINTSRVAAILNSLCKKNYIERISDEKDKRKVRIYITEEGKKCCIQKHREVIYNVAKLLEYLGEDDAKEYIRIMKKISNIIEKVSDESIE